MYITNAFGVISTMYKVYLQIKYYEPHFDREILCALILLVVQLT